MNESKRNTTRGHRDEVLPRSGEGTSLCATCGFGTTRASGITTLGCGCTYHPQCIHNFFRGHTRCVVCPRDESTEERALDFGDHPNIVEAHKRALFGLASCPSGSSEQVRTGKSSGEKAGKRLWDRFMAHAQAPAGSAWLTSADQWVAQKVPLSQYKQKGITARALATCGVCYATWTAAGYTFGDLLDIGCTQEDCWAMKIPADLLAKQPITTLVDRMGFDGPGLDRIGVGPEHLSCARRSVDDLLALKVTSHYLAETKESDHVPFQYLTTQEVLRMGLFSPRG